VQEEVLYEARLIEYPAGGMTVDRDDGRGTVLVAWGLVRTYVSWSSDRQLTLAYHPPGALLESLALTGLALSHGLQAMEPAGILHLDQPRLERLAGEHSELALAFAGNLRERLGQAYRSLAINAFASVRERVAADLLARSLAQGPGAGVRVTLQQLADATGSVRVVVARAMRELRRKGVVATSSAYLTIVDPVALRREAGLAG
jgi:CRP-like cAMP-binding protein